MIYMFLFWEFLKIGLFAFGGGMAAVPFLYDMAERYKWFDSVDISNMIAISESTPGPIGINMATYTGYQVAGILGAIVSTFSLVLPSLILVIIMSKLLDYYKGNRYIKNIENILRLTTIGLIISVFIDIINVSLCTGSEYLIFGVDIRYLVLFIILMILTKVSNFHIVVYITLGAVVGVILGLL